MVPERSRTEFVLFCTTLEAAVIATPIVSVFVPPPKLVILPVVVILPPVILIPLSIALSFLIVTFPVPPIPLEMFNCELPLILLFVKINPLTPVVIAPLTVKPDVVLFSVIPLTREPIGADIVSGFAPVPALVIVPSILNWLPVKLIVPKPFLMERLLPVSYTHLTLPTKRIV